MGIEEKVREQLLALQDIPYRDFHSGLMPNVDKETVIGVRTPQLRAFAKQFAKTPEAAAFMKMLPHRYYEENNLHGLLVEGLGDYCHCIEELNRFLPYVNNWATCDLISPKVFRKRPPQLVEQLRLWIASGHTYTVRFGIGMLMKFYLDDAFSPEYPELAAQIRSEEYYVKMMVAWYFATALAKRYEAVLPYIEGRRLEPWTHNKAIQKAVESRRVTDGQKAYLKTLKCRLP